MDGVMDGVVDKRENWSQSPGPNSLFFNYVSCPRILLATRANKSPFCLS